MTLVPTIDDPDGDWTAPGVFRCAPGVHRIPLPLPNDGLRAVNVYAIEDGSGWTLVDSGWVLRESKELLESALRALGSGLGDVHRFLVTHVHRDHYTQAVALRREFGMKVALGRGEQPSIEAIQRADGSGPSHQAQLVRAGADSLLKELANVTPPVTDVTEWESPDEWIDDGAEFVVGERKLRALETPGHTRGHVVFADEESELLFAGDHVLPRITPSLGLEPKPGSSPLADFLTSLQLVRSRPDALLLPAHGPVGMRVHDRVDELLDHHARRLDATLTAVTGGRSTAYEVAEVLPWTRRERRLAELDLFNRTLATMETAAHLEVLVARGHLTASDVDGVVHYGVAHRTA